MSENGPFRPIDEEQLIRWASLDPDIALEEARALTDEPARMIDLLVEHALAGAEPGPAVSAAWLELAGRLSADLAPGAARSARAAVDYARARRAIALGDPAAAEEHLHRAQDEWRAQGDAAALGRSYLGLTQVLAMQGRYAEAETAAVAAVDSLATVDDLLHVRALRNLGTLQLYREHHAPALITFDLARAALADAETLRAGDDDWQAEAAHIALNAAGALTFLDQIEEAAAQLTVAVETFGRLGDTLNRGRARTNLGRLLLRTGRYMDALTQFEQAAIDVLGEQAAVRLETDNYRDLRAADELLLEWGLAYVTLRLLPEADQALGHARALFEDSAQPVELGQTRYTQGLLYALSDRAEDAVNAYQEALQLFTQLGNLYWQNRTRLALAALALAGSDPDSALATLAAVQPEDGGTVEIVALDLGTRFGRFLLAAHAHLAAGNFAQAEQSVTQLDAVLQEAGGGLAHLELDAEYLKARLARARRDPAAARAHLDRAAAHLDAQHNAFPLEEIRAAYLLDKEEIYADLLHLYLEQQLPLEQVFALIERARSQSLLERLSALTEASSGQGSIDASEQGPGNEALRAEVRRRLHWLYNQLLGDSGSRRQIGELSRELQRAEAILHRLEVAPSRATHPSSNETRLPPPAQLAQFQACLGVERAAVIYSMTGDEIFGLLVTQSDMRLYRHLASVDLIRRLLADLHFQIGRVETGRSTPARRTRLLAGVRNALHRLYAQIVAPLVSGLAQSQVIWIPYGMLHQVPFHALWDGDGYVVERLISSYAPSAAVALHMAQRDAESGDIESFAGLALDDPLIPATRDEISSGAAWFEEARLYFGEEATRESLTVAAREAHVLHLATHGLFRPDNPYFSAIKLADGWMDVRELYRLQLRARLVVLSACESGAALRTGGDELIGLTRGFMGAGARALVVSQWNVHDTSAADLMARFYAHFRTRCDNAYHAPAAALAVAQREMIAAGMHPYYWAAFRAVGGA